MKALIHVIHTSYTHTCQHCHQWALWYTTLARHCKYYLTDQLSMTPTAGVMQIHLMQ